MAVTEIIIFESDCFLDNWSVLEPVHNEAIIFCYSRHKFVDYAFGFDVQIGNSE